MQVSTLKLRLNIQLGYGEIFLPSVSSCTDSQELPDIAPVHTHRGHFGAAVLVEFVATRLATEAVQKKLLANVAERQFQVCFPNLRKTEVG